MQLLDISPLPGYSPEVGLLLAAMQDSTREWRENLGEVSVDAITWQMVPNTYSIGTLILHLVDCEDYWFRNMAAGLERDPDDVELLLSDELDQYEGRWPTPPAKPLSWYYELHDRVRLRAFESLKGIDPNRRFERPARNREYTLRWIVAHVLEHDSYTGGQAVAVHEIYKKMWNK